MKGVLLTSAGLVLLFAAVHVHRAEADHGAHSLTPASQTLVVGQTGTVTLVATDDFTVDPSDGFALGTTSSPSDSPIVRYIALSAAAGAIGIGSDHVIINDSDPGLDADTTAGTRTWTATIRCVREGTTTLSFTQGATVTANVTCVAPPLGPRPLLGAFGTARVDGVLGPGEYPSSGCTDFVTQTTGIEPPEGPYRGRLCVMNDRSNLYAAVRIDNDSTISATGVLVDTVGIFFDRGDSTARVGDDIIAASRVLGPLDLAALGVVDNHYVVLGFSAFDSAQGGANDVSGAIAMMEQLYELGHPLCSGDLRDFCVQPGDRVGFCLDYNGSHFPAWCGGVVVGDAQNNGLIRILAEPPPSEQHPRLSQAGFAAAVVAGAEQSAERNRQVAAAVPPARPVVVPPSTGQGGAAAPAAVGIRPPATGDGGLARKTDAWRRGWLLAGGLLTIAVGPFLLLHAGRRLRKE